MYLTYLDSNTWLIELSGKRILLDPWLVGPLVFGGQRWFFAGEREKERAIPENIDLILLSQGLPDHAHAPTLKQLDRQIPVVGSPSAADVARNLGYTSVTAIAPGDHFTWNDLLKFEAFPGSPIGPFQVENAYVVTDLSAQTSLYYEPHGFHSETVQSIQQVDVVVTPLLNLSLPLVGPFIKGGDSALEIIRWLSPQFVVPTTTIGNVVYTGVLNSVLNVQGSFDEFERRMAAENLATQLLTAPAGERFAVPVTTAQSTMA